MDNHCAASGKGGCWRFDVDLGRTRVRGQGGMRWTHATGPEVGRVSGVERSR